MRAYQLDVGGKVIADCVTKEALEAATRLLYEEPKEVKVRAGDVKPYRWALWCQVEGGPSKPFANEIFTRAWDGAGKIWFGLDSHNGYGPFDPDEVLSLIPYRSRYMTDEWLEMLDRRDEEKMRDGFAKVRRCE